MKTVKKSVWEHSIWSILPPFFSVVISKYLIHYQIDYPLLEYSGIKLNEIIISDH